MDYDEDFNVESKENLNQLINEIKHYRKKLVIFAGAGVSALCGLPLWCDFASMLVNDCYIDHYIDYKTKCEFSDVARRDAKLAITLINTIYKNKDAESKFYEHFKKHMEYNDTNENDIISSLRGVIKKLQASIITTNADDILDSCVFSENDDVYYGKKFLDLDFNNLNNPFVIHIHGSINDCNSLVFTVKQYLETYSRSNEKFYENLNRLLNNSDYVLFFIGSSMSEMELLQYLLANNKNGNRFILNGFYKNQTVLENIEKKYYLDCFGIKQISYSLDERGYDGILDYLNKIANDITNYTNVTLELYKRVKDSIQQNNIDVIIQRLVYAIDSLSLEVFSKILDLINEQTNRFEIYYKLLEEKSEIFDWSQLKNKSNCIQKIVFASICEKRSQKDIKTFEKPNKNMEDFLNKMDKSFKNYLKTRGIDEESCLIVTSYVKLMSLSSKQYSREITKIFDLTLANGYDYAQNILYQITYIDLSESSCYKILNSLLQNKLVVSDKFSIYDVESFAKENLFKILRYNYKGIFSLVRKLINSRSIDYRDMGAIIDYCNYSEFLTYSNFLIELLKMIIENLDICDIETIYNGIPMRGSINKKIKLYIIDYYFESYKNCLNRNLIDSINSVASLGWIIKHHRNEILQDKEFKENLIELIENCQFKNETSKDALALKSILKSILDDIDYKKQKKYGSKYENYDFENIGKLYWTIDNTDVDINEYSKAKSLDCEAFIKYMNDNSKKIMWEDDFVAKYFKTKQNMIDLLKNPEVFKRLENHNLYSYIFSMLYSDNNIDKKIIIEFLNSILDVVDKDNAWIWLDIIEKNDLVEHSCFNEEILNVIYCKLIDNNYFNEKTQIDTYINFMLNNNLCKCYQLLCKFHIKNNDIESFVRNSLLDTKSNSNKIILIFAFTLLYDEIGLRIEDSNNNVINDILEKDENKISFLNAYIFTSHLDLEYIIKSLLNVSLFDKLDDISKQFYSDCIINHYNYFDVQFVHQIIIKAKELNVSKIIQNYGDDKQDNFDSLVNIVDFILENRNINGNDLISILEFSSSFFTKKTKKLCKEACNKEYRHINFDKMKEVFNIFLDLDEVFFIKDIFVPFSKKYLGINYNLKKYKECFDYVESKIENPESKDEMENLRIYFFNKGYTEFWNADEKLEDFDLIKK